MFGVKKNDLGLKDTTLRITGTHVCGLPFAENTLCNVSAYQDHISFKSDSVNIHLSVSKLIGASIKSEAEVKSQYVSSVGGAIAGGLLLGSLGAVVGGRAKEKKHTTLSQFLVFTYQNESGVQNIIINVTGSYSKAGKIVDYYKSKITPIKIEL
ncbi:MAG TPA: hypothetical protein PKD52_04055 [Clostridiales bacterium]|nr:hypothetical protein [Clostridiales bacterium]